MLFPDCRRDDYYNEDFLDGKDSEFVKGFDWATEAVDHLFEGEEQLTDGSDFVEIFLHTAIPEDILEKYTMEFRFPEAHSEDRVIKTYGDYIRFKILDWLENERNELITSMIDQMSTEHEMLYNSIRNKVLTDNAEKEHPKEYYDTRHEMFTGEKTCGPVEDMDT